MAKTYATGRKKHENVKTLLTGRKRIKDTKTDKVINYLKRNGSITTWEAIEQFRATRLSAIIFNLRLQGFMIRSEKVEQIDGTSFVRYQLDNPFQ